MRRHDALSRHQAGLRRLFAEVPVLSERTRRKILRSIHEGARDIARDIATTEAYVTSRREMTRCVGHYLIG
jgi:hypothetical protein